jgi:hypothetical protein
MNGHLWMILGDKFKEVTMFDYFKFKQFLHNGFKVLVGDAIKMTGEMYGCIFSEEDNEYIVVIDEEYTKNASSEELGFFLYHEIGHAFHRHEFDGKENGFYYSERELYAKTGGVFKCEKEADDYAVSHVGAETSAKALLNIVKRMETEFGASFEDNDATILESNLRALRILEREYGFSEAV